MCETVTDMQRSLDGVQLRTTRRLLRILCVAMLAVFGASLLIWVGARLVLFIEVRRAGAFLHQVERVQLGQTADSVQSLCREYEDVKSASSTNTDPDTHTLRVDPWHLYRPFAGPHWIDAAIKGIISKGGNLRRVLGLRFWTVNAELRFKDDHVHSVGATVTVEGENEWLLAHWNSVLEIPLVLRQTHEFRPEMSRYLISWTHLHIGKETGEGIMNFITPLATTEEQDAARNINLQCLTSLPGCHSLCDLMPHANRYRREHGYPDLGWNSGSWSPQDKACE